MLLCGLLCWHTVQGQPLMVWLRPKSVNLEVNGVQIVAGPELEFMQELSKLLPGYQHQYESYPLKRSWYLVKNSQDDTSTAYCFFGASYTVERQNWGYFTLPTTVLLPYPLVSRVGQLDSFVQNGTVSVKDLFARGMSTVTFGDTRNMWSDLLNDYHYENGSIIRIAPGERSAALITAELLKKGRIDFGYVGSGYQTISELEKQLQFKLSIYQIREFEDKVRAGNRLLCSKSPLGLAIKRDIDGALTDIAREPALNAAFRELNFRMIGYHPLLKANFEQAWQHYFKSGESPN